jgi:RNA polymerase sigma-70 factor (ECF subfamily)
VDCPLSRSLNPLLASVVLNWRSVVEPHGGDPYETRLVERFRGGDAHALTALFEMHVDRVYAYALHILGSREDAEEVVSEAFLRAFRRAADFRGEAPFRGWVFGIARNLCRDRLRQPRLLLLPEATQPDLAGEDDAGRTALRADVRSALAALPDEYRDVLLLCDVEEWDAREAANLLDRSLAATKSLLYRARRALRTRLTELWNEEE